MYTFKEQLERTLSIATTPKLARDLLCRPESLVGLLPELEALEPLGGSSYRFSFREIKLPGLRIKPAYSARYEDVPYGCRWCPLGHDVMRSWGSITLKPDVGGERVTLSYRERVELDVEIPPGLARLVAPLARKMMRDGTEAYLRRAAAALESRNVDLAAVRGDG